MTSPSRITYLYAVYYYHYRDNRIIVIITHPSIYSHFVFYNISKSCMTFPNVTFTGLYSQGGF